MPMRAATWCVTPGCAGHGPGLCGRCLAARGRHTQPDAGSKGYTSPAWRAFRLRCLAAAPHCGDRPTPAPQTTDSGCAARGQPVRGTVVDHVVRVTGPHDPRFLDPHAAQTLCRQCHQRKRGRERHEASVTQHHVTVNDHDTTTWG